jgi:peptide deformylase
MKLTKRVLYNRAKPVTFSSVFQNQQLADRMVEFMNKEQALGLAAPQIGLGKRVFVMNVYDQERRCFNPEIVESSENQEQFDEGCLSFPGESCIIIRPSTVAVRYQDAQGTWFEDRLVGLEARCFQHELDHLDGITMWDRYKEQNAKQS